MQYTFPPILFLFCARRHPAFVHTSRPGCLQAKTAAVWLARQHGFAIVEFLVVALPLLLAAMASYEASRWYMTREAVSLALLEAGRAGSVNHARPRAIEDAFLDALTPLYAPAGDFRDPRERMIHQHKRVEQNSNQLAWDIIITHPNIAEFADFMQKDLPIAVQTGNPAINNNYQQRQHQQFPRGPPRVARSTMPTPCNCRHAICMCPSCRACERYCVPCSAPSVLPDRHWPPRVRYRSAHQLQLKCNRIRCSGCPSKQPTFAIGSAMHLPTHRHRYASRPDPAIAAATRRAALPGGLHRPTQRFPATGLPRRPGLMPIKQ